MKPISWVLVEISLFLPRQISFSGLKCPSKWPLIAFWRDFLCLHPSSLTQFHLFLVTTRPLVFKTKRLIVIQIQRCLKIDRNNYLLLNSSQLQSCKNLIHFINNANLYRFGNLFLFSKRSSFELYFSTSLVAKNNIVV